MEGRKSSAEHVERINQVPYLLGSKDQFFVWNVFDHAIVFGDPWKGEYLSAQRQRLLTFLEFLDLENCGSEELLR